MTIEEFLTARLDELQVVAENAEGASYFLDLSQPWGRLIDAMPASRVLASIETQRALLADEIAPYFHKGAQVGTLPTSRLLRLLAAVYSDHPDYRQEWKP